MKILFINIFVIITITRTVIAESNFIKKECWEQRNSLLSWEAQSYSQEVAKLRLQTLTNIDAFKKECKSEIKHFPEIKKIFAKVPEEIMDAQQRVNKFEEFFKKQNSKECKIIKKKQEFCVKAGMIKDVEARPDLINGIEPKSWFNVMFKQLEDFNKEIVNLGGNPVTTDYCGIVKKDTGRHISAVHTNPLKTEITALCGE